jgi:hypothetical protein
LSSLNGPVVQRLERTAHNGVVAGSNPAGPTTLRSFGASGGTPLSIRRETAHQNLDYAASANGGFDIQERFAATDGFGIKDVIFGTADNFGIAVGFGASALRRCKRRSP